MTASLRAPLRWWTAVALHACSTEELARVTKRLTRDRAVGSREQTFFAAHCDRFAHHAAPADRAVVDLSACLGRRAQIEALVAAVASTPTCVALTWRGPPLGFKHRGLHVRLGAALASLRKLPAPHTLVHDDGTWWQPLDVAQVHALLRAASLRVVAINAAVGAAVCVPMAVDRASVQFALLKDLLARHGTAHIVARGDSMLPHIADGARLCLSTARPLQLRDVVAVAGPRDALLVHRIVGIRADGAVLLQGDAYAAPDGWFERAAILGVVVDFDHRP